MTYIEWFHEGKLPRERVGGKGASLSELAGAGFPVPGGFCVNAEGYRRFVATGGIDERLEQALAGAHLETFEGVQAASHHVASLLEDAQLPDDLREEIGEAYDSLTAMTGLACAVRSSAISEDGASASFAGLYESYLNVRGVTDVLTAVRRCYASLWSERAIRHRARGGARGAPPGWHAPSGSERTLRYPARGGAVGAHDEAMGVVIMGLVPSDVSGIAFTAHPVTGARDLVVINSSWGLGEAVVSGRVTPDFFVIDKNSFAVLERDIFTKELAIYSHPDGGGTIERQIPADKRSVASLSDEQAQEVARLAARVEAQYGRPQDVEWGLANHQLFLLQSRPITTLE